MEYRIVTNGRDFKIQRRGKGLIIAKDFFDEEWSYKLKNIR